MRHKHNWKADDVAKVGGCRENPGCFSQGAKQLRITSVAPMDRGEYVETTAASGRVTKRDNRNWS
jgi:hypothetical protein